MTARPIIETKKDFARFTACPGLEGLEAMSARWVSHSFSKHMHESYTIGLNYKGRGAYDCRGERRDAAPGTCNLIAPGELHDGHATSEQGWTYRNLYIETPLMQRLLAAVEWNGSLEPTFDVPVIQDPVLGKRLAQVFAGLEHQASLLEEESWLLSVVARLVTDHIAPVHSLREAGAEPAAVRRVRDWLDEEFRANVSVRRLAEIADLSPYYLVRVFQRHVGVPPHRYQTIVRVNQARRLLQSGTPIAEVAHRTGFCDQSHLNRCFKRLYGVTPGVYASLNRMSS